ncbi:MAG: bifunctional adenosylcobinamide kinase/adenosylcobinamide-phosphate guanylyltransferase [Lachnospiraceae bacterium]|jgi:adenosylcobinamide kinase/adenosylcobinamide-phosphate guanylyltransferase
MILVIGGAFQGKKEYTKQQFGISDTDITDGATCELDAVYHAVCVSHFHEWIKRMIAQGSESVPLAEKLWQTNPDVILISNELGYGVVPVDAFDREYREATGRICTWLASRAKEVHRVVCGIGTVIKHD